jgi:hypothetical protein
MILNLLTVVLSTSGFPAEVSMATGGPTPACSLCHTGPTMRGTVTTPFGRALFAKGLVAYDGASLRAALMGLGSADSDGDGAADVDELKMGGDPNVSSRSPMTTPTPQYGCNAVGGGLGFLLLVRCRRHSVR